MIKKNYLLLVFLALAGTFSASAKKISETEAAAEATKFCQMLMGGNNYPVNSLSRVAFSSRPANPTNEDYYIFNNPDGGFVIIAGDDRMNKVLGYSDKGCIDTQNLPPQLEGLLKQYSQTIQSLPEDAPQHKSWTRGVELGDEVVLNTPTWNQGYPFNVKAPEYVDGNGETMRSPIGCVATAFAIAMKYKGYPTKAIKDFEYTWYSDGTPHTVNYGQLNIDYSKLRDNYENLEAPLPADEEKTIGDLMYAVAGAVNMQFGVESSAYPSFAPSALHEIFGFSTDCQFISRNYFTDEKWRSLIKEQIDADLPIIYSGYDDFGGHTFVCDGYNSEGHYHINWGWGGLSNGFFMLDDMLGFTQYQSMIINFHQDHPYDPSKHSRAWLSNGTRGSTEGVGRAAGVKMNTNNVETGTPFALTAGQFVSSYDFDGVISVALIDANDNIIEMSDGNHIDSYYYKNSIDKGWTWIERSGLRFGVTFTQPIKDDYRVALYTMETGEDVWKRMLGSLDAPTEVPVRGNNFDFPKVNLTIHGDASKLTSYRENAPNLMFGETYQANYKVDHGVATLYVDGERKLNANDFIPIEYPFFMEKESYDIDIYYYPYSELLNKEYHVATPGTLQSLIGKDEIEKIWKLRLTGEINHEDLYFLSDLPCLMHLDMEDAHIVKNEKGRENFIPEFMGEGFFLDKPTLGLETCKLPKNLKGFEAYGLTTWNIECLDIPATVDTYETYGPNLGVGGIGAGVPGFLNVQNPVPVTTHEHGLHLQRELAVLFVPTGSKAAYEVHPSWQGFKEIIETSEPFIGEYVDVDNVHYLILNNCATVSGVYGGVETAEIKSAVEYNGKTYPVKYLSPRRMNNISCLVINNNEPLDYKNIYNNTECEHIVSPFLEPKIVNMSYRNLYVPGKAKIQDMLEMWTYKLNKKTGRLLVESNYDEVTIKSVSINGKEIAPDDNHVYEFEPTDNVTVSVVFEAFGSNTLTTTYDAAFNASLENEEIETGIVNAINDDKGDIIVYTVSGMKMKRSDLKHLPKGVYIINGKKYMVK